MSRRIATLALLLVALTACRARIHHGLTEREANELQTVLQEAGVDARKVPEEGKKPTWAIEVPDASAAEAIRLLDALELPRPRLEGVARVLSSSSMVPTATEERLKELHLLSEQAALALQRVDGVSSAQVQLSLPPPPRPGQPRAPAKAAAIVRVRPGAMSQVAPLREDLRALVAGGVDGLSPDAVDLVLQETARPAVRKEGAGRSMTRMGLLALVLGVLALAASGGLAFLVLRLREAQSRVHELRASIPPPVPARPVVSPSARKAA
ncbi:MAG: flagellar M-ring protein FliF [Myxococcaceae bacterium]|nr:flagellar M-ring protein FliF [Myxococcaceae bacterium]